MRHKIIMHVNCYRYQSNQNVRLRYILIISILFLKTRIIRSISDELEERITTFSWPRTRDTRNYQLLVICHARSNVTSLNLSFKKRGQSTTKKSQSCVKIVGNCNKLPIKIHSTGHRGRDCMVVGFLLSVYSYPSTEWSLAVAHAWE
jgi:hypothetical protein